MRTVLIFALLLLSTWGIYSLSNRIKEPSYPPFYEYEYSVKGNYSVGSHLTVSSIDTIPPTKESGGIIRVNLSSQ